MFRLAETKALAPSALIQELRARKQEQAFVRMGLDPTLPLPPTLMQSQWSASMDQLGTLVDSTKFVLGYLDRSSWTVDQAEQIEHLLRTLLPHLLLFPSEEWNESFDLVGTEAPGQADSEDSEDDDRGARKQRKGTADLRKTLLKKTHDELTAGTSNDDTDAESGPDDEASDADDASDAADDEETGEAEEWDSRGNSAAMDPSRSGVQLFFANAKIYYFVRLVQVG